MIRFDFDVRRSPGLIATTVAVLALGCVPEAHPSTDTGTSGVSTAGSESGSESESSTGSITTLQPESSSDGGGESSSSSSAGTGSESGSGGSETGGSDSGTGGSETGGSGTGALLEPDADGSDAPQDDAAIDPIDRALLRTLPPWSWRE